MAVDLGKQYGPLPLGAWVVVVAGGLGIAWYSKRSGTPTEPVEDTGGQPGVGDGSVGGWTSTQPPTGGGTADPRDAVTDNDKWYTYISRELIGRFNYDPLLVDSALRKYLAGGGGLSMSEWVIIRAAISIMSPPNPIPGSPGDQAPPVVTPPNGNPGPIPPHIPHSPVPHQPPTDRRRGIPRPPAPGVPGPVIPRPVPSKPRPVPKPAVRRHTVSRGETLSSISRRYYKTSARWPVIYAANRKGKRRSDGTFGMISTPNHIEPKWVLHIP